MRVVVVGAGVMGLAAARVLAERGHDVTALDRYGVGNAASSSPGPTRIWRLAHPDRSMVRLAGRTVELWRDLERRSGRTLLLRTGLLWRGGDAEEVGKALEAEQVEMSWLDAGECTTVFPAVPLRPGWPAVWQPEAGALLAAEGLRVQAEMLARAEGLLISGETVTSVEQRGGGVRVFGRRSTYDADVAVVTAGPWTSTFLEQLGVGVTLRPVLEQVSYFGGPADWATWPALIEGPVLHHEGVEHGHPDAPIYAMPTPGVGYKMGIDVPLRPWADGDRDRTPDPGVTEAAARRISGYAGLVPIALRSEVCSWTSSPDERFILDRVGDVVIGCGDSGQGFKFSPLLGELLADLAEGSQPGADARQFGLDRFVGDAG